jgi:hypothetical protein
MEDMSVCHEVRVLDLRKLMRTSAHTDIKESMPTSVTVNAPGNTSPRSTSAKYAGRRRSVGDVGLPGTISKGGVGVGGDQGILRAEDTGTGASKRVSPVINVASISSAPDVAYVNYTPPAVRAPLDAPARLHKPALTIVLTNGSVLCLDIEV